MNAPLLLLEADEKRELRERLIANLVFERLATIKTGEHERLSFREMEAFGCLIRGETIRGAATRIGINWHSVATYRDKVARKLELQNRRDDLLCYAFKIALERSK